jgi:hypothetical protein
VDPGKAAARHALVRVGHHRPCRGSSPVRREVPMSGLVMGEMDEIEDGE